MNMKKLNIYTAYVVVSLCFTCICLSCTKDSRSETLNSVNENLNGDSDEDSNEDLGEDFCFVRIKSSKQTTKSFHDNNLYTYEYNAIYDGKKIITEETYLSGKLSSRSTYEYEGLVCIGETDNYDINTGNKTSTCISNIEYLDDTYLRIKSNKQTTKNFHDNNLYTYEYNAVYDDKKVITEETYLSGKLSFRSTYEYEGLVRIGETDNYDINTGNKTSTCISNIEYLD